MTNVNKSAFLDTLDQCLRDVDADLGGLEQQACMLEAAVELDVLEGKLEDLQQDVALLEHGTGTSKRLTRRDTGERLASIISGIVAVKERLESLRSHS